MPRSLCKSGRSITSTICLKLSAQVRIVFDVLKGPRPLCKSGRSIRSTICFELCRQRSIIFEVLKEYQGRCANQGAGLHQHLSQIVRTGRYSFWGAKRIPRSLCKSGRWIGSTICFKLCRQVSILFEVLKEYQGRCANQDARLHPRSASNCTDK